MPSPLRGSSAEASPVSRPEVVVRLALLPLHQLLLGVGRGVPCPPLPRRTGYAVSSGALLHVDGVESAPPHGRRRPGTGLDGGPRNRSSPRRRQRYRRPLRPPAGEPQPVSISPASTARASRLFPLLFCLSCSVPPFFCGCRDEYNGTRREQPAPGVSCIAPKRKESFLMRKDSSYATQMSRGGGILRYDQFPRGPGVSTPCTNGRQVS